MRNRQYIGARYVPTFFNNPNGGNDWLANVIYEPLTIVTYASNSFTSKKLVTADIGNPSENPEYWAATGNYNAQVENYRQETLTLAAKVTEIEEDIAENKDTLENAIDVSYLEYFRNKTICVIGDSISDNTTNPPNWVEHFKTIVGSVNASVTNVARNGASVLGFYNEINLVPTGYDIYIVMLGVNDFQGEFPLSAVRPAFYGLLDRIQTLSNDVFYVSPIKTFGTARTTRYTPLSMYREMFETLASEMGVYVISGYNLPRLNVHTQSTALSDTLHPSSSFAPVIADYIINAMLSRVSTFSNTTYSQKSANVLIENGGGDCIINVYENFRFSIAVNLLNITLAPGWNDICEVCDSSNNSFGLLSSGIVRSAPVELNTGTILQARISDGKFQLYTQGVKTFNAWMVIDFFVPVSVMNN